MRADERLLSKVRVDENGCWRWQAAIHRTGYGHFKLDGRMLQAHRAAYVLLVGEIPEGTFVCHRCDVRDCVNPDHLFIGSHLDNMRDMTFKGRQASRGRHGRAKLTSAQVEEIRRSTEPQCDLARRFGVCPATISYAKTGRNWSDAK